MLTLGVPVLPTLDPKRTIAFYVDELGFELVAEYPQPYLIFKRDAVELHFWGTDDAKLPHASSCYVRVDDIDALYAEYVTKGVRFLAELSLRPWGMRQFDVADPCGNALRFGQAPAR